MTRNDLPPEVRRLSERAKALERQQHRLQQAFIDLYQKHVELHEHLVAAEVDVPEDLVAIEEESALAETLCRGANQTEGEATRTRDTGAHDEPAYQRPSAGVVEDRSSRRPTEDPTDDDYTI